MKMQRILFATGRSFSGRQRALFCSFLALTRRLPWSRWFSARLLFCYENVPLKRAQNGSRLSAGSLRYAIAHSGGTGDGIRFPSKCFQSFEIAVYLSVAVKRIVVVRTEVMESSLVFKNVVYGDQHGMGDCKRGSIFATSSRNSLVLCKEIRTLYGFCRLCTLRQNRFECLISFRRLTMFSSSCALVVTGTDTSPWAEMCCTGESAHIQSNFRQNNFCTSSGNARDFVYCLNLSRSPCCTCNTTWIRGQ